MLESLCEDRPQQVMKAKLQWGKDIFVAWNLLWQAVQQHNQGCHWEELALCLPATQIYSISSYPVLKRLENTEISQLS